MIMWVGNSAFKQPEKFPLVLQRFREMGVNTGMVHGDADPKPWVDANFPYYVENIVNKGLCLKWNSKLQKPGGGDRWDEFVTEWSKTGRSKDAFIREYCLDDQEWLDWAKERMRSAARKHKPNKPVAYNIRDELSTTISANPFDYCFCPKTLAAFRIWLKTQYNDLAALNAQWETKFASWDEVRPFTTDEIKNRMAEGLAIPRGNPDWQALQKLKFDPIEARKNPTRWNFSPWCDFRTYMDISLARVLGELRAAAHEIDPETPVGIEGTQMPHPFGGYDLWRLSQVVDWIEPYDIGNAREIFGSFMPGKTIMTTVFESDTNHAKRRLWHLLLEGDKGCIIWWSEDCIDWKSDDYALTPKAKALAPVLKEITSPLAQLFMRAKREYDPIVIHYSQPSIQVDWLLESTVDGSTWHRRFSSYESAHNVMARERNSQYQTIQNLGYSLRYFTTSELEKHAIKDLILIMETPVSYSFPPTKKIQTIAPFDEHGRWLNQETFSLPQSKPRENEFETDESIKNILSRISLRRQVSLVDPKQMLNEIVLAAPDGKITKTTAYHSPDAHTAIYRYTLGKARLFAIERNINYHMSEDLKQAGGNEALEKPIDLEVRFGAHEYVYDLRKQKYLGQTDHVNFTLDPWQPTLFALLLEKVDEKKVIEWLAMQK